MTPQISQEVEYRGVEGFRGYHVGDDGSVWSSLKLCGKLPSRTDGEWHIRKPRKSPEGYLYLCLSRGGKKQHFGTVHLLVLAAFKGPRPDGMQGCHNNGNPSDCRAENLRWDTPFNNQQDKIRHGTSLRGTKSFGAKLNDQSVRVIRKEVAGGSHPRVLAKSFGVSVSTIYAILSGDNWGWLDAEANSPQEKVA